MPQSFSCILPHRGVIRVGGADRRAFLQGLISNDVELCAPGKPIYAAFLTPQGKFLHDLFLFDTGDEFLVDCEAARADDLLTRLGKYKLRAKVTLTAAPEFEVIAGAGDTDPRLPALGLRGVAPRGSHAEGDFTAYDKHRLTLGVPDGSRDMIVEKSTLLECNLDKLNAISWSKGCYMGQELTARMHHRGLVKKRLYPVRIEGPTPAFGTVITLNGEDVGDMRSSCGEVGLALLNIEKAESNTVFDCGGGKLKAIA